MKIAVIPARGGSQRIPRKNIRAFCGQPMLAWPIQTALASGCFDRVVVSTDDTEIAEVARAYGAQVPFLRPPSLSDHHTPTRPVINHAIEEVTRLWGAVAQVCCLYATAPLVRAADLRLGLDRLMTSHMDFAFTVTSYPFPIQRALRLLPQGGVSMFHSEHAGTRSQDLEPSYHDAGQFYWGHARAFLRGLDMYSDRSVPIVLPRYRVQDIDTIEDWERAEQIMRLQLAHEQTHELE
jgi:pseudaminic acid cytidylyltransferase